MAPDSAANHNHAFDVTNALTSLASDLPPDTVRLAEHTDGNIDGASPSLHVYGTRPDDIATTLAICNRLGAVVVPRGGGTHLHIGSPPDHVDVLLDGARHAVEWTERLAGRHDGIRGIGALEGLGCQHQRHGVAVAVYLVHPG